jgi:hypothetical protein
VVIFPLPWTRREGVLAAEGWRQLDGLRESAWSHDHGVAFFRHEWEARGVPQPAILRILPQGVDMKWERRIGARDVVDDTLDIVVVSK